MTRRILCLSLMLCLLLALPLPARALEERLDGCAVKLTEGATLEQAVWWTGSDLRTEYQLTIAPGSELRPMLVAGETLCSTGTMAQAVARAEAGGVHAAAGVNGGYFNTSVLTPAGLVVENGVLRSGAAENAWMTALGFRADGTVLYGKPKESLELRAGDRTLAVESLNLSRGTGLAAFTDDFNAKGNTGASGWGWNLSCTLDGPVRLGTRLTLTVTGVSRDKGAVTVPKGGMVLSLACGQDEEAPEWLRPLRPGDELTLTVGCAKGWETAESAVALLYPLLEDGELCPDLSRALQPRTAVGVKADGTLIVLTVDGRQSGYSVGIGLEALAKRFLALGCVEAATLDGGGSTALGAVMPGETALSLQSSPSGGAARRVVNYLLFVTEEQPTGKAARLVLDPLRVYALTGAKIPLTVKAVDEHGYAASAPKTLSYSIPASLGTVKDGVLYCTGAGVGTLTVSAPGLESVSVPVTVAAEPDSMALYGEVYGAYTSSLRIETGETMDLTVRAWYRHIRLTTRDECFNWSLEAKGGSVDETGKISPAAATGTGTLTVSAGKRSVSIPVSTWTGIPFVDVPTTDPYFEAVRYVYDNHVFAGVNDHRFSPGKVMTRGMLVTVLWRLAGEPEAETAPGFEDVAEDDWFAPAVAWAAETGLVLGYSETRFGPMDDLKKEQIVAILYRAALGAEEAAEAEAEPEGEAKTETKEKDPLEAFTDAETVSDWALDALRWAAEHGMLDPDGDGALLPREPMTRAAVAELMMRYLERE